MTVVVVLILLKEDLAFLEVVLVPSTLALDEALDPVGMRPSSEGLLQTPRPHSEENAQSCATSRDRIELMN